MPSSTKWRRFAGWERQWLLRAFVVSGTVYTQNTTSSFTVDGDPNAWGLDYPQSDLLDVSEYALEKLIPDKAARTLFGTVDEATFRKFVEEGT